MLSQSIHFKKRNSYIEIEKSTAMGIKSNFYQKPFFITNKSVPVWIFSIFVAITLIFFFGTYFEITDQAHAVNFLSTNAELLVIILAVTMSFTLLGLQFLAESYTPRALGMYLKDRVIYGFPILYIFLISLNLISITFPSILDPIKFMQFAVIGTIFSLVYLVGLIYYIVGKIQPEKVLEDTSKNISDDIWKEIIKNQGRTDIGSVSFKPFIILEQTMIKAINKNDIFSYVQGLKILFGKLEQYLEHIQNEFLTHKDPTKRRRDSYYVYTFFFRLFSQLFAECLTHNREHFIMQYQLHLFDLLTKLYEYKHRHALNDFWEHIEYLGNKIFNLEMITACDYYIRHIENIMKIEFEAIKKNGSLFPNQDALRSRSRTDDEPFNKFFIRDFHRKQINTLTVFAEISARKKINKLVVQINWILEDMLSESLQLRYKSIRKMNVYILLKSMTKINKVSVDHGLGSTSTVEYIEQSLETLDIQYVDEVKELTKHMCEMGLYSIEHGDFIQITEFGIACRSVVDKHPESVIVILEYLGKAYDVIQNESNTEIKSQWTSQIIDEIKYAETWNINHHASISEKVTELLESKHDSTGSV